RPRLVSSTQGSHEEHTASAETTCVARSAAGRHDGNGGQPALPRCPERAVGQGGHPSGIARAGAGGAPGVSVAALLHRYAAASVGRRTRARQPWTSRGTGLGGPIAAASLGPAASFRGP